MKAESGVMNYNPRITKTDGQLPEVRREAWNRFSLAALSRNQHCPHLISDFQLPGL
jgi:hypothetical protein